MEEPGQAGSPQTVLRALLYLRGMMLRNMALSTGNPEWWDKYQACAG